jgi:hypothetical protein
VFLAVLFGSLQSGGVWTPPPQAWAILVAFLFAFAQFGAISCLARWSKGPRRFLDGMFAAFVIFAAMSAFGVHHAWEQYREAAWHRAGEQLETVRLERIAERAPWLTIQREANATIASANAALVSLAGETGTVTSRLNSRSAALERSITAAQATLERAAAELERLPEIERQAAARPWDYFDALFILFAIAIGVLEFAIWAQPRAVTAKPVVAPPPPAPIAEPPARAIVRRTRQATTRQEYSGWN